MLGCILERSIERFLFYFLFLLVSVSLFGFEAQAASKTGADRPEILDAKSRLEASITKKYKDLISTKIQSDRFNVGVTVTFEVPPDMPLPLETGATTPQANKNLQQLQTDLLSDISLGIIDSYNQGVNNSNAKSEKTERIEKIEPRAKVQVKKVEIYVGLDSNLGDAYKQKFATWLKTSVRAEFGNIGISKVENLPEIPKVEPPKPLPEVPRPLNWEERFGNFQNLIGLSVIAILFIVGLLLSKFLPSKDTNEQINASLRLQEMKNSQVQRDSQKSIIKPSENQKSNESNTNSTVVFDNYRDHQKKVAFIAMTSPVQVDQVLDLWFGEGEDGRKKTACLVDCVLTQVGITQMSSGAINPDVEWSLPEKIKNDKNLPPIFRSFAEYSLSEKTDFLEKCYWDLLSVKTLGERTMKQRFTGISQLSPQKIHKILSSQDQKVKSLTLLHLPQEKLEQVIAEMSFDEKKNVILHSLETPKVRQNEIEIVDETLTFLVTREGSLEEGMVEIQSMIPNLLMVLSPSEEIRIIREISPKLSDKGRYLRQNYPALAFVGEWPQDKFKALFNQASISEIKAFLQIMPELTNSLMGVLPARMRTILKDEVGKSEMTAIELDQSMEGLKLRLFQMVNEGRVVLSQIFKSDEPKQSKPAEKAA